MKEWENEIDEMFHNKYGEIIPELTFGLFIQNKLIGIIISSIFNNKPLILTVKYLNNLIEQNHSPIKRRNKFYQSLRTDSSTIKGMETIRGLYKKSQKEFLLFGFSVCIEMTVLMGIPEPIL